MTGWQQRDHANDHSRDDAGCRQAAKRQSPDGAPTPSIASADDLGRGQRPDLTGGVIGHLLQFAC
jgi:hypothetical protein